MTQTCSNLGITSCHHFSWLRWVAPDNYALTYRHHKMLITFPVCCWYLYTFIRPTRWHRYGLGITRRCHILCLLSLFVLAVAFGAVGGERHVLGQLGSTRLAGLHGEASRGSSQHVRPGVHGVTTGRVNACTSHTHGPLLQVSRRNRNLS